MRPRSENHSQGVRLGRSARDNGEEGREGRRVLMCAVDGVCT